MQTVKIVSCFGSQVDESTVIALNSEQKVLPFDMLNEMNKAVKEGVVLEKAVSMHHNLCY